MFDEHSQIHKGGYKLSLQIIIALLQVILELYLKF